MKIFKNIFPILIFLSLFNISMLNVDTKKQGTDCVVQLGGDITINFWDTYQLHALVNYPPHEIEEIIWSPTEILSCTDCLDPKITTLEEVCISLTVNFSDGCSASDEMCITFQGCKNTFPENKINSITPTTISDAAEIELEIAQTQFVHIEIVENDEIINSIFEGWLENGLHQLNLDFSQVPTGNHSLRVRLYPENKFITITKL